MGDDIKILAYLPKEKAVDTQYTLKTFAEFKNNEQVQIVSCEIDKESREYNVISIKKYCEYLASHPRNNLTIKRTKEWIFCRIFFEEYLTRAI